ncbi:MAG: hypothetical protein ACYCZJ_11875 [Sulfuriferula sp.]
MNHGLALKLMATLSRFIVINDYDGELLSFIHYVGNRMCKANPMPAGNIQYLAANAPVIGAHRINNGKYCGKPGLIFDTYGEL